MSSHLMDEMRTINEIIQSIIAMLQKRKSSEPTQVNDDQALGYTKCLFMKNTKSLKA